MDTISSKILKMFKDENIDIFTLTPEDRTKKINEYQNIIKQKNKDRVKEYNKMNYQNKKDTYFKEYYQTHYKDLQEKWKQRYLKKIAKET